ncbi:MAG: 50S ribosomal protein L29 [Gammaproteobacteria bacterium]
MSQAQKRRIALREKAPAALREELSALRREHFNLRMQKAMQQTSKTSELRRVRRDIARARTILAEKERT